MQLVVVARCLSLVFTLGVTLSFGQLFLDPTQAFGTFPYLNPTEIQQQGLSQLRGKIYTKMPGEMIKETNGYIQFQFDSLGQTIYMLSYRPHRSFKDSIIHRFVYDHGLLIEHYAERCNDYSKTFYMFNQKILESTEERIGLKKQGEELVTNRLDYLYTNEAFKQTTDIHYHGGLAYKKQVNLLDSLGRVFEVNEIESLTDDTITTQYLYNDNNQVVQKTVTDQNKVLTYIYTYQEDRQLSAVKTYRNMITQSEIQILYHRGSTQLNAILSLDSNTKLLEIIRF